MINLWNNSGIRFAVNTWNENREGTGNEWKGREEKVWRDNVMSPTVGTWVKACTAVLHCYEVCICGCLFGNSSKFFHVRWTKGKLPSLRGWTLFHGLVLQRTTTASSLLASWITLPISQIIFQFHLSSAISGIANTLGHGGSFSKQQPKSDEAYQETATREAPFSPDSLYLLYYLDVPIS